MFHKVFICWLSLLPLITWQGRFEAPKVFWLLSGGIILIIHLSLNVNKLAITKKDKWYLLWLLWLLICTFFNNNFSLSILGGSYRNQGIIFFFCLWLMAKTIEFFSKKQKETLYKLVGVVVLIESFIILAGQRLGTLGEINAVSGFLAIGLFYVYKYLSKWFLPLVILAMYMDFSKAGFLSLIPFVFKKINLTFILLLAYLVFILKPINLNSPFENRQVIWKHSVNLISESPIIGYGTETNEMLFDKVFYESGFPLSELRIDRSHNLLLDILIWSGFVGFIFFIKFLYESYKALDSARRKAFFAFLIFAMFQPLSIAHWLLFILII